MENQFQDVVKLKLKYKIFNNSGGEKSLSQIVYDYPKIYFCCCNDEEYNNYFNEITRTIENIYQQDRKTIVMFYNEGSNDVIDDIEIIEPDVLLVQITEGILFDENNSNRKEIIFAKEHGLNIVPIVDIEDYGMTEEYKELFGDVQFLCKNLDDKQKYTLSFEEKLHSYLDAYLLDSKLIDKVKNNFTDRVFLSYRKVDRKYARDFMRLFHKNSNYDRIGIWYDEFLTLGEHFEKDIRKEIKKCKYFVLIVTKNITEPGNYVRRVEFPEAIEKRNKTDDFHIISAKYENYDFESVLKDEDDRSLLNEIKNAVDLTNVDEGNALEKIEDFFGMVKKKLTNDQKYLLGLAYMKGILVECDIDKSTNYFFQVAEDNNENNEKRAQSYSQLFNIYFYGIQRNIDFDLAYEMLKKQEPLICDDYELLKNYQRKINVLSCDERHKEKYQDLENTIDKQIKLLNYLISNEKDNDRIADLNFNLSNAYSNYALIYRVNGKIEEAISFNNKALDIQKKYKKMPIYCIGYARSLGGLANTYFCNGEYGKAKATLKETINFIKKIIKSNLVTDTNLAHDLLASTHFNYCEYCCYQSFSKRNIDTSIGLIENGIEHIETAISILESKDYKNDFVKTNIIKYKIHLCEQNTRLLFLLLKKNKNKKYSVNFNSLEFRSTVEKLIVETNNALKNLYSDAIELEKISPRTLGSYYYVYGSYKIVVNEMNHHFGDFEGLEMLNKAQNIFDNIKYVSQDEKVYLNRIMQMKDMYRKDISKQVIIWE